MKSVIYSLAASLPLVLPTQADSLWEQVSCFTSVGNMENMGTFEFQSVDHCIAQCDEVNGVFAAVQEESCYCGTAALDIQDMALADGDSACNASCPGYAVDTCGGDGVYSLWVSQEYVLSLGGDDDDDDDDDNANDNNADNKGYDYGDEDGGSDGEENEDGEDSDSDYHSGWHSTFTAVATITPSSTSATNPVSTSASLSSLASSMTASTTQTATGSAAITTTTSTSGASRRFRILFF
ncbi:hypothetical protein BO99DRAFT_447256 [Aspergillus violaceofuscus CBS 115571]|uniref:WSC domain-containing protein n=1 Tax=Aspergillus violaceofuscus (strain CBS 115571) TaxID=1450538 RepID=A0A2V5HPX2_ASPV1|nr:hypothetical protein BO99DRAFT_447256 [Aspergillus violaceofuscus CBS 115571]